MSASTRRLIACAAAVLVGAGTLTAVPASAIDPSPERLQGPDRYATAVAVSDYWDRFDPGLGVVYIASGVTFADALSAAPAAAYEGGPLLLVQPDSLPTVVRDELTRLNPRTIKVVGGENAVSSNVTDDLEAYHQVGGSVIRVSGADRYATSRAVVAGAFTGHNPSNDSAFIATGNNFPDALAAAGAAGANTMPVILVNGASGTVDAATLGLIDDLNYTFLNIAGGTVAVSQGVEDTLEGAPFVQNVNRYAGADRYETGALINDAWFNSPTTAFIANGQGFADALAGAARAGFVQAPLYTTDPNCLPRSVADSLFAYDPSKVYLLGGLSALSSNVENLIPCDEIE